MMNFISSEAPGVIHLEEDFGQLLLDPFPIRFSVALWWFLESTCQPLEKDKVKCNSLSLEIHQVINGTFLGDKHNG